VRELEQFFLDHKKLEAKAVTVAGPRGRAHAEQVIREAGHAYRKTFARGGLSMIATKEVPTMMIELSSEELAVLRESLEIYLTDFRREVAGTENPEMRHRLQRKQNTLEGIVSRFGRQAAA